MSSSSQPSLPVFPAWLYVSGGEESVEKHTLKIACLNIGGRLGTQGYELCGATRVHGVLFDYDIIALLDTQIGHDQFTPPSGYRWEPCCQDTNTSPSHKPHTTHGFGVLIREGLWSAEVVEIIDMNERRGWLRVGRPSEAYYVACVYAPTQATAAHDTHEFWNKLIAETHLYQSKGPVFVMGDLNGHAGENASKENRVANANGKIIDDFCVTFDLSILNDEYAPGKPTWRRSASSHSDATVIDYVLADAVAIERGAVQGM